MRKKTKQTAKFLSVLLVFALTLTSCGTGKQTSTSGSVRFGGNTETEETETEETDTSEEEDPAASAEDAEEGNFRKTVPGYVESRDFDDYEYASENNAEFEKYLDDYFADQVEADSISYNYSVKDGDKFGVTAPEATLGDASMSEEDIQEQQKEDEKTYQDLVAFEDQPLTEKERWTYLTLKADLEVDYQVYDNIWLYEPFSPMRGLQSNITTNFTDYRFDDKQDVEDYVTLIGQVRDYFDQYLEFEREKSEKGYFMSEANAEDVIDQCNTFTEDPENNYMITVFNNRVRDLDFLTEEEKESYQQRNREAVENSMIPAFQDVADTFTELKGTGKEGGETAFEGGKEYYRDYIVPTFSGAYKTPEELIQQMETQQQELMLQLSMIYSRDEEAYQEFSDQNGDLFQTVDQWEPQRIITYLQDNAMSDFPEMGEIPFTVNYLDKSMESIMENTLAYYMSPAIDDQEHNLIYINGAHSDGLWTTLAHEGCPGHMYQNAYFMSTNPDKVRAISGNLGYQEGWAVYSSYQTLSQYDFDGSAHAADLASLYQINEELGYMVEGRVDLGVNYEGWDLEDVKKYLDDSGFGSDSAQEIIDTITGDPGAYLSYSSSYFEYKEMRSDTEEAMGSNFDPVAYHQVILEAGPCQFGLLHERVDAYIEDNR